MTDNHTKVVVMIACHKDPAALYELCKFFTGIEGFICVVHVDKKSTVNFTQCKSLDNVHFISDSDRVNVSWGTFSQVEATLKLLNFAADFHPDYYWFMSGQDFPIKSRSYIKRFFDTALLDKLNFLDIRPSPFFRKRNAVFYPQLFIGLGSFRRMLRGVSFLLSHLSVGLRRIDFLVYHGSSWFCLHSDVASFVRAESLCNRYKQFFRNSVCPDESFFQTIIANEMSNTAIGDYLVYVDWTKGGANPKILDCDDFERLISSDKLIARKFDRAVSPEVLEKVTSYILTNDIGTDDN